MTREASVATLRRLAEAVERWHGSHVEGRGYAIAFAEEALPALAAYRSEIAPLRTRAEVDAEIATLIRDYHRHITRPGWKERCDWDSFSVGQKNDLERLCREPTRDSGPSSADAEEVPSPRPPASPAGADLLQRVELLERYLGPSALEWARSQMPSGPPGAVAAKESRDNAAAPEGAAIERDCNCDQALHLERRIGDAVRAIRRSNTIPAGLLHELLGILEGEA
jgi:hypothetical protein